MSCWNELKDDVILTAALIDIAILSKHLAKEISFRTYFYKAICLE